MLFARIVKTLIFVIGTLSAMTACRRTLVQLTNFIARDDDSDASLASLARRTGWSKFDLQRRFAKFAGETPKRFAQRVRLERAAAELLATRTSLLGIALDTGFAGPEVFSRAFRRRFGRSPREFRNAVRLDPEHMARHRSVIRSVSPCVGLYRVSLEEETARMFKPAIERRVLEIAQPILFIQRRVAPSELQPAMAECFGALYGHGQAAGLAVAGHPMARYAATGPGLWTVDFIMPLAVPAPISGEMQAGTLASGPVAFAVHEGPYDTLSATHAAIERWVEANGHEVSGAPWEWYVTDPGEWPDPADWRTEIFWPLKAF
jgi:AraC family transcriptional regulator